MIKFKCFGFGGNEETTTTALPEAPPPEMAPLPEDNQINAGGKRVLIVDDDPVFLTATRVKLQSAGLRVKTAKESSEAIAALGEEPVDAILMDITFQPDVCYGGMGSWDGFQIMAWLRGSPAAKGARFIIVSNSDSEADRRRAQALGAVAYFQKPLDFERLLATVDAEN